jgi:hypothetical protein
MGEPGVEVDRERTPLVPSPTPMPATTSLNFEFLRAKHPELATLGTFETETRMSRRSAPHGSVPAPTRLGQVARVLLSASLLPVAGCGDPEPSRFTKLFTTEHFVYYTEEGVAPPCDATDQWLERYYSANAKFMGATLPPGEKIEYYFAPSEVPRQCPGAAHCARGRTIYASDPLVPHEIVHANAFLVGSPPALFTEGLAVVLGCKATGDMLGPLDVSEPIESLVETRAFNDWGEANGWGVYSASASFVRYLMDGFGASRFLSFYARARGDGGRQEIEDVFQSEIGVRLDDAFSDWRTKPHPHLSDLCLRLMECDPTMPALVSTEVALGCGPMGAFPTVQEAVLPFEVPKDRIVHLTTEPVPAEPQAFPSVAFYRCAGGDVVGKSNNTSGLVGGADHALHIDPAQPGEAFALDVPPGEYVAWFQAAEGGAGARVRVDVAEQRSPMRNIACQGAEQPLALDDKHPTVLASRWIERPCQGPWCPGQSWDVSIGATGGTLEAQALSVRGEANFSPGALYICSEPCPVDASQCDVLDLDPANPQPARSKQTFEPGAIVHLGAPAALFADRFVVRLRLIPE